MRNLIIAICVLAILACNVSGGRISGGGWSALNLTQTMMLDCSAISANTAYFSTESGNAQATVYSTTDGGNTFNSIANNGKALFPFTITMYNSTIGVSSGVSLAAGAA